jgi:hypothetical protein
MTGCDVAIDLIDEDHRLRMMMPESAIVPSIATKPNGFPNNKSASVTPISPRGAVNTTIRHPRKAPELNHQQRQHDDDEQRHARNNRFLSFRRILERSAASIR